MASRGEVFELVKKYLPRQALTGKGINLEFLRRRLREETDLSEDVIYGKKSARPAEVKKGSSKVKKVPKEPQIIVFKVIPSIRNRIFSYVPHSIYKESPVKISDSDIIFYYKLEELIGVSTLPPWDNETDLAYLYLITSSYGERAKKSGSNPDYPYRLFDFYNRLVNESLTPYLPYLEWGGRQLLHEGVLTKKLSPGDYRTILGDAFKHSIENGFMEMYQVLVKLAPEEYFKIDHDQLIDLALVTARRSLNRIKRDPHLTEKGVFTKKGAEFEQLFVRDNLTRAEDLLKRIKTIDYTSDNPYRWDLGLERILEDFKDYPEFPKVKEYLEALIRAEKRRE